MILNFKNSYNSNDKKVHKKNKLIILSIVILISLLSLIIFFSIYISNYNNTNIYSTYNVDNVNNDKLINSSNVNYINISNKNVKELSLANLTIPKLDLYNIEIKEGVDSNVLENNIGHFSETPWQNGNVGLAAHNRGSSFNYFSNINKLNIGDEIYYVYAGTKKKYVVNNTVIIDSYDWSYLLNTNYNMLTLITCVSGNESLRCCVQAIEV